MYFHASETERFILLPCSSRAIRQDIFIGIIYWILSSFIGVLKHDLLSYMPIIYMHWVKGTFKVHMQRTVPELIIPTEHNSILILLNVL